MSGVLLDHTGFLSSADPTIQEIFHNHKWNKYSPEQKLLIAVLQDVYNCICGWGATTPVSRERQRRIARAWVMANDRTIADKFTFVYLCESLDLDVGYLRKILLKLEFQPAKRSGGPGKTSLVEKLTHDRRVETK